MPNYQLTFQKFYENLHLFQENLRGSTHCTLTSYGRQNNDPSQTSLSNPWKLWQRGIKVASQLILKWGDYPALSRWSRVITRAFHTGRGGKREAGRHMPQSDLAPCCWFCRRRKGLPAEECRRGLEARQARDWILLEPPEGTGLPTPRV